MQGMMKNRPGPRAPPLRILPSRKITARSYSCTIFIHIRSEIGAVMTMKNIDTTVRMNVHTELWPSSGSANLQPVLIPVLFQLGSARLVSCRFCRIASCLVSSVVTSLSPALFSFRTSQSIIRAIRSRGKLTMFCSDGPRLSTVRSVRFIL